MAGEQNWRIGTDATDYFQSRQKEVDVEKRRPTIRRASDLVGPGLAATAVNLTDFNDVLATFNGFFSAKPGALNAPNGGGQFVGLIAADAELGGVQVFTELDSGIEYRRSFQRYPGDESVILWGPWETAGGGAVAGAEDSYMPTTVPSGGSLTALLAPTLSGVGLEDAVVSTGTTGTTILIQRPGVYTGSVLVTGILSLTITAELTVPFNGTPRTRAVSTVSLAGGVRIPFTAIHTTGSGAISLRVLHNNASSQNISWREFQIARVGDAT